MKCEIHQAIAFINYMMKKQRDYDTTTVNPPVTTLTTANNNHYQPQFNQQQKPSKLQTTKGKHEQRPRPTLSPHVHTS